MRNQLTCLLLILTICSCSHPTEKPEDAANAFIGLVHQQHCEKAFALFSSASQKVIREESAAAIKGAPYYAQQFSPENLYCASTYANRYLSYVKGSATPKKIAGTNAVIEAKLREGTKFLIPGFYPTGHTNIPVEMHLVRESGAWKIDLLAPRQARQQKMKEEAIAHEKNTERIWIEHEKTRMEIQQRCPEKLTLLARWTLSAQPEGDIILDETGQFKATLSGAKILTAPDGGLHFEAEADSATLPESLLQERACGVIAFWFRKESSGRMDKILTRVSSPRDLVISTQPDGSINFNMPGQSIQCRSSLEAGKFYHLAMVWNDEGQKVYINGNVRIHGRQVAILKSAGAIGLGGVSPYQGNKTGPRMTIRDLQFWEGKAGDADIQKIFQETN